MPSQNSHKVALIIPVFRCKDQVLEVLSRIGHEVDEIFVVDDACPDRTGEIVQARCRDPRVRVLFHRQNRGVGGAMLSGYRAAIARGARFLVKIDGDGQMDPSDIRRFLIPLLNGRADYAKGNRFHSLKSLHQMPVIRVVGNLGLTLLSKAATGYWRLMDPTNGFTALRSETFQRLSSETIDPSYFFESDMLFHLKKLNAEVVDIPMTAHYGSEKSHLSVSYVLKTFPKKYLNRTLERCKNPGGQFQSARS